MKFSEPKQLTSSPVKIQSACFSADGAMIAFSFTKGRRCGIFLKQLATGRTRWLAGKENAADDSYWDLQFTPDGESLVCYLSEDDEETGVLVSIELATGTQKRLTDRGKAMRPDLSPDGRKIVFESWQKGAADIHRVAVGGGRAERITQTFANETHSDAESPDDSIYVYHPGNLFPQYSPDGTQIAFASSAYDGKTDNRLQLCVMSADGSEWQRLTDLPRNVHDILWHPNGRQIAFTVHADLPAGVAHRLWNYSLNIYLIKADGSGLRRLENSYSLNRLGNFRPGDGRYLCYSSSCESRFSEGRHNLDIRIIDVKTGEVLSVTDNDIYDTAPIFSPDGKTLLFVTERTSESGVTGEHLHSVEMTE